MNQIADLKVDIERDQDNIQLFQTQIGTVIANPGDAVRVFSNAVPPNGPYAPRKLMNIVLGILLGLMLAAGLIVLIDYIDNTVKSTLDFPELVGGPLLATVRTIDRIKSGRSQLFMLDDPKGVPAESIRLLRANIEFASATRELVTISLTSPNPGEGKSTISANLAVALAQGGFVTMLIDADLRRPTQHRIFGVANDRGLSTLLAYPEREWDWAARETMVPNLSVIPSGPLPPNPADLLSLDRLRQILQDLRDAVDVIVVDSPPILAVSDPLIIAAHVDGTALVSLGGKTRLDALKRAAQILHREQYVVVVEQMNGNGNVLLNRSTSSPSSTLSRVASEKKRSGGPADAAGDVPKNFADVESLTRDVGFRPCTSLQEGLRRFTAWYRGYYRV